jgi:DNA-binding response OmpR family regulator
MALIATREPCETLQRELHGLGVPSVAVRTAGKALLELQHGRFDCVLVDSLEVCRRIRSITDVPIVIVADANAIDPVAGFEAGADDHVSGASPAELAARIRARARRYHRQAGPSPLVVGDLRVDLAQSAVVLAKRSISLNRHELAILVALAAQPGKPISRAELLRATELKHERLIDIHVSRLRVKLGEPPGQGTRLQTIRGAGYMLVLRT